MINETAGTAGPTKAMPPPESKKWRDRREKVSVILPILKRTYPDARCSLDFKTPLQLLVATILSAQCTDERVNAVTKTLFKKYKSAEDYARVPCPRFAGMLGSEIFTRTPLSRVTISVGQQNG